MTGEPTLKFSSDYAKLPVDWEGTRAQFVFKGVLNLAMQSPAFIEFDTRQRDGGHYALPKSGAFLVLGFVHETGLFFQTLRRWTKQKEAYYDSLLGKWFELVMRE
jgi:hypothetical protein